MNIIWQWVKDCFTASTVNPKLLKVGKRYRQRTLGSVALYVFAALSIILFQLDPVLTAMTIALSLTGAYLLNRRVFGAEYRTFKVEDIHVIENCLIVSFKNGSTGAITLDNEPALSFGPGHRRVLLYGIF
jgi:hypothetical protein